MQQGAEYCRFYVAFIEELLWDYSTCTQGAVCMLVWRKSKDVLVDYHAPTF